MSILMTKTGVVTSNKMDKTVVVMVQRKVAHAIYRKFITQRKKFVAHDEKNVCKMGDTVEIVQCRPLSKTKRWQVTKVIKTSEEQVS